MGDVSIRKKENTVRSGIFRFLKAVLDLAYYAAFVFCVGWVFVADSTMFRSIIPDAAKERMDGYYHLAAAAALVCALAALLLQDSIRLALFAVVLMVTAYIQYQVGGHKFSYYVLSVLIVGAIGRSFRKILTVWLAVGSLIMAVTFFASQTGVIEDLVYRGTRHSYGIVYCTDCAAHILFLMISYAMLRLPAFHVWDYAVLVFGLAFMWGTGGKTNMIGAGLLILGILAASLLRRREIRRRLPGKGRFLAPAAKACGAAMCLSFPACAVFSFVSALTIGGRSLEADTIQKESLLKRLQMGCKALHEHPLTIFGTKIKEHSFGGQTTHPDGWWENKYFFIDNSYLRLYLFGGVILFCLFLAVLTYAQIRCFLARKYLFVYFLMIVAIVCVLEHHLVDFVFHIFTLLAFSGGDMLERKGRSGTARPETQAI